MNGGRGFNPAFTPSLAVQNPGFLYLFILFFCFLEILCYYKRERERERSSLPNTPQPHVCAREKERER